MSSPTAGTGGEYFHIAPPFSNSYHLLELTVISAQDLFPQSRSSMRTYAVAWLDPENRHHTRLDSIGHINPTWNDKFVFRVADATLRSSTSAVTIDIFAAKSRFLPGKPTLIGTARAIISTLNPGSVTRFAAIQVRRPTSLRPQGILNIAIALVDAHARSMPLYAGGGGAGLREPSAMAVSPKAERNGSVRATKKKNDHKEKKEIESRWKKGVPLESGEVILSKLEKWKREVPAESGEVILPKFENLHIKREVLPPPPMPESGEIMASKLEKWKNELTPLQVREEKNKGLWVEGKRRRSFGRLSYMNGVGENVEGGGGRPIDRG